MIDIQNISKHFGAFQALKNVSMRVGPGEIHAVLGENGAGKTTLMNILFGLQQPDSGTIRIHERAVRIASPRIARQLGIGMVHQHFKLTPTLTVLENIVLAIGSGYLAGQRTGLIHQVDQWLRTLHWEIPLSATISDLSVGQRQRVEIIKALCAGGKVLILDEPTASLAPAEVEDLFSAVRALAGRGMTVVFISHKLAQVAALCSRVTILRLGEVVYSDSLVGTTLPMLADKMMGGGIVARQPEVGKSSPGPVRLEISNLNIVRNGVAVLSNASLRVHAGEILGIAGLEGNGQSALVECISSARSVKSAAGGSRLSVDPIADKKWNQRTWRRPVAQFACIPEDRRTEGLVMSLSVEANIMLKAHRHSPFVRWGLLRFARWRKWTLDRVHEFDIRCPDIQTPVGALSGGNQQKVVLARELTGSPEFILAVNPTRGLDIGATAFVMNQLLRARAGGAAILLVHADLDELLAVSDRVSVIYAGGLTPTAWPATSREQIGRLMLGVRP